MPFDPYERAADRAAERAGAPPVPEDGAGPGTPPDGARPGTPPDAPGPPPPPDALSVRSGGRNIARKVMLGLIVLLFLMRLGASRRPQAPELAADCARPAFKLSATSVAQNKPVAYRIVGPDGRRYVLGFDTETFAPASDGGWDAVPKPGREGSVLVAAGVEQMKGCTRTGLFATPVPVGTHTVTLYELTAAGVLFVDEQELEVTEP